MPEQFESNTLRNTDVLERLYGTTDKPLAAKSSLFKTFPLIDPIQTEQLRPGVRLQGVQMSNTHRYQVKVRFQDVDLRESFLCGYLTIEGLTEEYPSLTTFFEGEIIGKRYKFQTRKWDANLESDIDHWSKFDYWKEKYQKYIYDDTVTANPFQDTHVFMRWKEQFLVPDHRITQVTGASYSGFYYTCMNMASGQIDGYYYHSNSERFQRILLDTDHNDTFESFQFR